MEDDPFGFDDDEQIPTEYNEEDPFEADDNVIDDTLLDDENESNQNFNDEMNSRDPFMESNNHASNGAEFEDPVGENPLDNFLARWKVKIDEKDATNLASKKKMSESGKKELAGFYEERKRKLAAKGRTNREEEKEFTDAITEALTSENPWERVISLVDVSNKEKEERDLSRLKNILIQLKNSPI